MLALFSIAGVRKNEDPIASTAQTGAIPLKQKLEETKDGPKGAPSPSMSFYGNEEVLTGSPVKSETAEEIVEEKKPVEEEVQAEFEEEDAWETEAGLEDEINQESAENAVEDEDSWWTEDEAEPPS